MGFPMRKTFLIIRLFFNLSRVAKNANNTAAGLRVADCLWKLGLLDCEIEILRKDVRGEQYFQQRRLLPEYNLAKLHQLPQNTLGYIYADHMIKNNLKPDFYRKIEIQNDVTYLMMRMRETHDLWHIITGFGTSVPGELGLQAFMFSQINTPLAPLLIGGRTLISTFTNPREVVEIYDQVSQGWAMGRKAGLIFGLSWEEYWATPLTELRNLFNVQAI